MDAWPIGRGNLVREEEPTRFVASGDDRRLECAIAQLRRPTRDQVRPGWSEVRARRLLSLRHRRIWRRSRASPGGWTGSDYPTDSVTDQTLERDLAPAGF